MRHLTEAIRRALEENEPRLPRDVYVALRRLGSHGGGGNTVWYPAPGPKGVLRAVKMGLAVLTGKEKGYVSFQRTPEGDKFFPRR